MKGKVWIVLASLLIAGCASTPAEPPPFTGPVAANWRSVATSDDRRRIREWRTAFVTALAQANVGHAAEIAREGVLLQPDAALTDEAGLPEGAYRCRVIKLGAKRAGMLDYVAYPAFDCRVTGEGEVSSFAKISGSQRPVGLVFDNKGARQIFLGTLMLGDETMAVDYGRDADRDLAGTIERIGPRRWRMLLPYPRFESIMDVIELVPAA